MRRPDGGEFFETNALLFLPLERLGETLGQLQAATPFISMLARNPNWRGLSQATLAALGGVQAQQYSLDTLAPIFDRFSSTLDDIAADRPASFSWQEFLTGRKSKPNDLRRFVDIWPALDYSALEPGRQATDAVRKAAADANLKSDYQARLRLTGSVPIADEEFATVKEGALINAIGTVAIVLADPVACAQVGAHHRCRFHRADHRACDHGGARLPDGRLAQLDFGRVLCPVRRSRRRFLHPVQRALS